MNSEKKNLTRKDFLKGMGTTLAGATLLGGMGSVLAGCSEAEVAEAKESMGLDAKQVEYPVAYTRMDPDKAAERAYKFYKEKGG
ncbi:hypothetical protein [Isachenkonia alkalipeptolytica]|uniref:Uncharacterized protein n=1 Tax=Isachenkonia alkalipeptolytica TaxID=2565777 RepID=A0AA43XJK9_9CLOT|nr:hypothetical protein [Isachenkonia alkalipeptolytica]NBG87772.1 hypothetical protein [Isachenkonia alkalipeptolytica]